LVHVTDKSSTVVNPGFHSDTPALADSITPSKLPFSISMPMRMEIACASSAFASGRTIMNSSPP
jgi:hypothetical protein